jgi:photosystem II stability/assembly factor-like uncharacterized protein
MRTIIIPLLLVFCIQLQAQYKKEQYPLPTPAEERLKGFELRQQLGINSLFSQLEFRSVGPAIMSGRITDVDVNPADPTVFYAAFASGGLAKTSNNGSSFTSLFDHEASMTIGDIAVDWTHGETIWIGTGESNSSRSSYAGTGIYKSTDLGKTWKNMGLIETQHIGKILINRKNPDIVWVAAMGHLYSPNSERGVFKTVDGGKSWRKVLYIDENSGAIDLVIDPSNSEILYASTWQRERYSWKFTGCGTGSGIYKSEDGGEKWAKISTGTNGFPTGEKVGRIGLAVSEKNPEVLYAILDNQDKHFPNPEEDTSKLTVKQLESIDMESFLKLPKEKIEAYLHDNDFPAKYSADSVIQMIRDGRLKPLALADYIQDANARLFNTPVIGAEIYRSHDAGKTWLKTNVKPLDQLFYSYGYYFGQIRIDPADENKIFALGVPIIKSIDGGKNFTVIDGDNLHSDHHALWIDPIRKGHLINGNDGGLNISYDDGVSWFKINNLPAGQFYSVNYDMATPYNVYGGMQDNGVWSGPSTYTENQGWQASGQYAYKEIVGGDGMQVEVDTRDNNWVYAGSQFGYYSRTNKTTGESKDIHPKGELGEANLRFNWQTPIYLSRHNQDILYIGSNRFHRSLNKGDTFETLSGDLTKGPKSGDVAYGTITTICESPMRFGLIYAGTDDGLIQVSMDGGINWKRLSDKLPRNYWISRVSASVHKEGRVYASLNGYRFDNFEALIYISDDYGQNWQRIGMNLPPECVNVIKEDPQNQDILYTGTDHSLYVSLNRGKDFMRMSKGLPDAPVHDLAIQPREHELIVGTHGRSIYIANVSQLEKLTPQVLNKPLHFFETEKIHFSASWGKASASWDTANIPSTHLVIYSKEECAAKISVKTEAGLVLSTFEIQLKKGLNFPIYNLTILPQAKEDYLKELEKSEKKKVKLAESEKGQVFLYKGKYTILVETGSSEEKQTLVIE